MVPGDVPAGETRRGPDIDDLYAPIHERADLPGRIRPQVRQVVDQGGRPFPVELAHHPEILRLVEPFVHFALDERLLREGEQPVRRLLKPDGRVLPVADLPAADGTAPWAGGRRSCRRGGAGGSSGAGSHTATLRPPAAYPRPRDRSSPHPRRRARRR